MNLLNQVNQNKVLEQVKWFTPNDLLSRNCLLNFAIGDRGGGKTFGVLKFVANRFKKYGEQFIYLRRTVEELKDSVPTLFDDIKAHGYFPNDEIKTNRKGIYFNDHLMGLPKALSTSMTRKSIALPKVRWIVFEEFMVDGKHSRYLGSGQDEVFIFQNFYETVARMKDLQGQDVRVIFIANAFSTVNIYFQAFNVRLPTQPPYKRYYTFNKDIAVCIWQEESYRKAKQQSRWAQLNKGSKFESHAYKNEFYLDTSTFIKLKPNDAEYHFSLVFQELTYSVWVDWSKGVYYISTKGGNATPENTIAFTLEDNNINNIGIRRVKNLPFMKMFRKAVDENSVFYDKLSTYHNLKEVVFLLNTVK